MQETEEVKKTMNVEIERLTRHLFVIEDVNSPEEAELMAEDFLADGEEGTVMESDITGIDSYEVDPPEDIN